MKKDIEINNNTVIILWKEYPPTQHNLNIVNKARKEENIEDRKEIYKQLSIVSLDI